MGSEHKPTIGREAWDRRYADRERVWGEAPDGVLEAWAVDRQPGRALDLACGQGRNALWLAERGWQVRAVDFSGVALARARQEAEDRGVAARVALLEADLEGLDLGAEAYDLVLLAYLQMPLDGLRPILRKAARAVAPGGTLLLLAHDLSNLTRGQGGPQSADLLYTPEDVVAALGEELAVLRAEVVRRRPRHAADGKDALDCLVVAQRGGRR